MTQCPRVVVLDHTAQLGGAEIALLRLLAALPPGWDVSVILFSDGKLNTEVAALGVQVEVIPLASEIATLSRHDLLNPTVLLRSIRDSRHFTRRLAHHLVTLGADLVVTNSLKSAVLGSIAARRARLPWVWHLHDRLSPEYLPLPAVISLRGLARTSTRVVANSTETAALTSVPTERVSVAYPGLPESAFTQGHRDISPPVFGLLGRISATKGQREFLNAAALVNATHPQAEFHIVGEAMFNDRPYADDVRGLPSKLGIGDRVRFTGWVDDPASTLDGFTALVHASPVPEPFGQVIVEAMARHVPVIATIGGGVSEIMTGAVAKPAIKQGMSLLTRFGQLVSPADPQGLAAAMAWTLDNPPEARELASAAADSAQARFTAAAMANSCVSAWRAALEARES